MTKVESSNRIVITHGDTLKVPIELLNPDGTPFKYETGDKIVFALSRYAGGDPDMKVDVDIESMVLYVPASDMAELNPGTYVYDLELTYKNGDVDTFVQGMMTIVDEVAK